MRKTLAALFAALMLAGGFAAPAMADGGPAAIGSANRCHSGEHSRNPVRPCARCLLCIHEHPPVTPPSGHDENAPVQHRG
jgi:hypothetical protein